MHSRRKFTPSVASQIGGWVQQGLSAAEIAGKIGCTLGTLRVRCSQFGISLRKPSNGQLCQSDRLKTNLNERLMLLVPRLTLEHVRRRARSRQLSESAFIAMLLEKIAEDDLYTAVLDDCEQQAA
jgi:hypothetical protein